MLTTNSYYIHLCLINSDFMWNNSLHTLQNNFDVLSGNVLITISNGQISYGSSYI